LPQRDLREHILHQIRCRGAHAAAHTRWTESAALTAKGDQKALVTRLATNSREAAAEQATVEVGIELFHRVLRQLYVERAVVNGAIERLNVIADNLIEDRRLRPTALVFGARSMLRGAFRG
jgi:hypothetical protein